MFHHIFFIKQHIFKLPLAVHQSLVKKMFGVGITTFAAALKAVKKDMA